MRKSAALTVLLLGILNAGAIAQTAATDPAALEPMAFFVGSWACSGAFAGSGKPISSTMIFGRDLGGLSIVKHHDDTSPPALYHAIELWGFSVSEKHFNAAIQDNFGNVRDFTSPGWDGDSLIWTSAAAVKPLQQFAYQKSSADSFTIAWRISRDGMQYKLGDTLTCKRA